MEEQREKIISHFPLLGVGGKGCSCFTCAATAGWAALEQPEEGTAPLGLQGGLYPPAHSCGTHHHCPHVQQGWGSGKEQTQKIQNFDRAISLNIVSFRITLKITAQKWTTD